MNNEAIDDPRQLFLEEAEYLELPITNPIVKTTKGILDLARLDTAVYAGTLKGIISENAHMICDLMLVDYMEGKTHPDDDIAKLIENYAYLHNRLFRDAAESAGKTLDELVEGEEVLR